jgi:hypothetical protein
MVLQVGKDVVLSGMYRVAGYPAVDFDDFHREELPRRLREGRSDAAIWDVIGAPPLAIVLPGDRAYSYVVRDGRIEVERGVVADAETVVHITDDDAWIDYLYEMRTRIGLLYSNAVTFAQGSLDTWDAWDPAIRHLYSGREMYRPETLEFVDRHGRPLDLERSFALDDDPADMTHFLRSTGYLVVRKAFDLGLVTELGAEINRIRDEAVEGELTSWWAEDPAGTKYPYRLTYLSDKSSLLASLYDHPRVRSLVGLSHEEVFPVPDRIEGVLAVLKEYSPGTQVSGFANLPFHNDCGMGGCHITCPCVLVGIQIDAANRDSSQLHMMAGSWGKAFHPFPDEQRQRELPIIPLVTEPGDATVHFGCGLHSGPGPTGPNARRTIYLQHYNVRAFDLIGPYSGYNEIMPGYGEGQIKNVEEIQAG